MSKKKILVIDDDVQLVDSVKTLMESAGYEVGCAYQAEKGVALAREMHPDLIVMDILFAGPPGPNGVEVSRQLAQDPELKDTPVIILSGVKKTLDMPVKLGPDETYMPVQAFLEKPFKPSELLADVRQLLALRDSIKEKGMGRILVVDDDPDFVDITTRVSESGRLRDCDRGQRSVGPGRHAPTQAGPGVAGHHDEHDSGWAERQ